MTSFKFAKVFSVVLFVAALRIGEAQTRPGQLWQPAPITGGIADHLKWISRFASFRIDVAQLRASLSAAPMESARPFLTCGLLELPNPDGEVQIFKVENSPIQTPAMERESNTHTYRVASVQDPSIHGRLDFGPNGFNGFIRDGERSYIISPPRVGAQDQVVVYYRSDNEAPKSFQCFTQPDSESNDSQLGQFTVSAGDTLKTYRLAMNATAEYTAEYGSEFAARQAVVTAINFVNDLYELDLSIRLTIVNNHCYSNPDTDPFTNGDQPRMLAENQITCDLNVGNAQYDIGHVFGTGSNSGLSMREKVGIALFKAMGVSSYGALYAPDYFFVVVAHEMGHQFGAKHTFAGTEGGCSGNSDSTAYEPGSGSTIMSYAGRCGSQNLQDLHDPYFHLSSLLAITAWRDNFLSGGSAVANGNFLPTANAGVDYAVPAGTPIKLTATGSDGNGDPLKYCWEIWETGAAGATNRSYTATSLPTRFIPPLANVLANIPDQWDPNLGARTARFRVTVRDNRTGGGGYGWDEMSVTASASSPFRVLSPNTAVTWNAGSQRTIQWQVGGGNVATNVRILLSTNGGYSYDTGGPSLIELLASTPNDGFATVTIPAVDTTNGRIIVEAIGNIFFDINDADLTITTLRPHLDSITPTSVPVGSGSFDLQVSGTNFEANSQIEWDGVALPTSQPSNVRLLASIPASFVTTAGTHQVTVRCNSNGFTSDNSKTLTVSPPGLYLDSISPSSKLAGSPAFTITAYGSGFLVGSTIRWNASNCSTSFISSSKLTASIPASYVASVGTAQVTVVNPGAPASNPKTFTIDSYSTFHTINFDSTYRPIRITLNRADKNGNKDGDTMFFRQFNHGESFTATAPGIAPNGTAFQFWTLDGAYVTTNLTVPIDVDNYHDMVAVYQGIQPVIDSISPSYKQVFDAAFTLTVNGSLLRPGTIVFWDDQAMPTRVISETLVEADIPASRLLTAVWDPGVRIYVGTNGFGYSNSVYLKLHNPIPVLAAMSPASAEVGSPGFTLTVHGDKFVTGGLDVQWDGVSFQANVASRYEAYVDIPAANLTAPGTHLIRVINAGPGGGSSSELLFTVTNPVPVVTLLTPTTVAALSPALTLAIEGSGFIPASAVEWNGSARTTTYVSSTHLTAEIPASDLEWPGTAYVTVLNPGPGGGTSYPAPFLISPAGNVLEVQSSPVTGISVGATVDLYGSGAGATRFSRTYTPGTHVSLSQPAQVTQGGVRYLYDHREKDGVPTTAPLVMDADQTATLVYVPGYVLTVQSVPTGVPIKVWTKDYYNRNDGTTQFTRTYKTGVTASLTAPVTTGTKAFDHWEKNSVPVGTARTINVPMTADTTVKAVYKDAFTLTFTAGNATAVPITVYQADVNALKNGTTDFTRLYLTGSSVSFTAPQVVGTKYFARWEKNGLVLSTSATVTISATNNATYKAVYNDGVVLTVSSETPSSGVPITIWTRDRAGQSNGTTTFTRLYAVGQTVSMTAPASMNGKAFVCWNIDGTVQPGPSRTITVTMSAAKTCTAMYSP